MSCRTHCRIEAANSTAYSVETRMSSAMRPSGLSTSSASRPSWYWRPECSQRCTVTRRQPRAPVELQAALEMELDGDADAGRRRRWRPGPTGDEQQREVLLLQRIEEVAVPDVEPQRDADVARHRERRGPRSAARRRRDSPAPSSSHTATTAKARTELCGVSTLVAEARIDPVELAQQGRPVEHAERAAHVRLVVQVGRLDHLGRHVDQRVLHDIAAICVLHESSSRCMALNASGTVLQAVSRPWLRRIMALLSPRSLTSASRSAVSSTTPS